MSQFREIDHTKVLSIVMRTPRDSIKIRLQSSDEPNNSYNIINPQNCDCLFDLFHRYSILFPEKEKSMKTLEKRIKRRMKLILEKNNKFLNKQKQIQTNLISDSAETSKDKSCFTQKLKDSVNEPTPFPVSTNKSIENSECEDLECKQPFETIAEIITKSIPKKYFPLLIEKNILISNKKDEFNHQNFSSPEVVSGKKDRPSFFKNIDFDWQFLHSPLDTISNDGLLIVQGLFLHSIFKNQINFLCKINQKNEKTVIFVDELFVFAPVTAYLHLKRKFVQLYSVDLLKASFIKGMLNSN